MTLYQNRNFEHLQKEKPRIYGRENLTVNNTINQLLRELTILKNKIKILNINLTLSQKRADKWKNKYQKDLKNHNKIILDNDQLNKVNEELNIMDTQKIKKIILLKHKIYELEGGQIVRRKNKTDK